MWDGNVFGEAIQRARKEQGLTQEQLGERLNVSGQAVSKWENAESSPDISLLPRLCSVLEISADVLVGTEQTQGLDGLVRAIRERLDRMEGAERTRRRSLILGHLLLKMSDERLDEWAGEDFLAWGRMRDDVLHAVTLITANGSIVHVHGTADLPGEDVGDETITAGLRLLGDPGSWRVLRRILADGKQGEAVREEARADPELRATCDTLVDAGYLVQRRQAYEMTNTGALFVGALLVLSSVPGWGEAPRRLRRAHTYNVD